MPNHKTLTIILDDDAPPAQPRIWTCAVCGKESVWGDGWRWYGSYALLDHYGGPEFVVCSTACRESDEAASLMADVAAKPKPRQTRSRRVPKPDRAGELRAKIAELQRALADVEGAPDA